MQQKEVHRILGALVNCRFAELWKGKEMENFYHFLVQQGLPAKGFLITIPIYLNENPDVEGWAWFWYKIRSVKNSPFQVEFDGSPVVMVPTTEEQFRECPPEWKGLPVWRWSSIKG